MNRRLTAAVAVAVVVAVGAGVWVSKRGPADLNGAKLEVTAAPGRADTTESGPVVPVLGPDDRLQLDAKLCPKRGGKLSGEVHAALWSAPGRGDWALRMQDVPLADAKGGCRAAHVDAAVAELWPGIDKGVVRWALVVGPSATTAPEGGSSAGWREQGLLVVDGEVIRMAASP